MILEAPKRFDNYSNLGVTFFLAGTIDNGSSIDWQSELENYSDEINVTVFNPRRKNWNKNADSEELETQIKWELEHMERADYIIMNILGDSKSPISLLEMGLHARDKKLFVFCPKSFYRYDNIRITCETYGIPLYSIDDYKDNMEAIKKVMYDRVK